MCVGLGAPDPPIECVGERPNGLGVGGGQCLELDGAEFEALIPEFVQDAHGIVNETAAQVRIGGESADQGFHVPVRHARRQCGLRAYSPAGERARTRQLEVVDFRDDREI